MECSFCGSAKATLRRRNRPAKAPIPNILDDAACSVSWGARRKSPPPDPLAGGGPQWRGSAPAREPVDRNPNTNPSTAIRRAQLKQQQQQLAAAKTQIEQSAQEAASKSKRVRCDAPAAACTCAAWHACGRHAVSGVRGTPCRDRSHRGARTAS